MIGKMIVVKAAWDPDAGVWFVESCDIPGLNAEAESLEALVEKLPAMILDLIDEGNSGEGEFDVPIELIAHASTRVRRPAA